MNAGNYLNLWTTSQKNDPLHKGSVVRTLLIIIGILSLMFISLYFIIIRMRTPEGKDFTKLSQPVKVIWTMYESALRGDIEGYLNTFVPEQQSIIKDTLKSKGQERFRLYLQEVAAGIMGISIITNNNNSVSNNEWAEDDTGFISIPVEIVFKGQNKLQVFKLKRLNGYWKISNVSSPILTPQTIPYGKNVNE